MNSGLLQSRVPRCRVAAAAMSALTPKRTPWAQGRLGLRGSAGSQRWDRTPPIGLPARASRGADGRLATVLTGVATGNSRHVNLLLDAWAAARLRPARLNAHCRALVLLDEVTK